MTALAHIGDKPSVPDFERYLEQLIAYLDGDEVFFRRTAI